MTAALIILALVALTEAGAIVALGLMLKPATARGDAAISKAAANERAQIEAERQRDDLTVKAETAQAAADKAIGELAMSHRQLASTQRELNAAIAMLVEDRKDKIATSDGRQLIDLINADIKNAAAKSEEP